VTQSPSQGTAILFLKTVQELQKLFSLKVKGKKVKVAIQQAVRAQRGSRGIGLLFL
jgi:hypothetical protein